MPASNNSRRKENSSQPIDRSYGHLQPQALEVEQVVLGALMIDSYAFSMVSEVLHPDKFYDPRHQLIFSAIQTLAMAEKAVDMLTVTEQLKTMGALETVGGMAYVMDLTNRVYSSANIEDHSKIIADKYLARQLISFASRVETQAFEEMVDVEDLMQETEGRLFELSQKNLKQDYQQAGPLLQRAAEVLQRAAQNKGGLTGLSTGVEKLDGLTGGWQNSGLVIIAGRPAMGKTSFALSLAVNIAIQQREPVAFFSLEMSDTQLMNRVISNVCEIEGRKILNGQLDKMDWERIDKNYTRMETAPLYVDETPSLSIFELRTKARRLVREKGVKIIMIDYLQLMTASGMKFGSRQEEVSTISKSLKGLAKELDIPIIALSQLNRGVENREGPEGKRPQLSDLRESGAIEQDADIVMFVHRPEYYKIYQDENNLDLRGKAEIIVAKHRKGATDIVTLAFKGQFTRFETVDNLTFSPPTEGEYVGSRMNISEDFPIPPPINDGDMPF